MRSYQTVSFASLLLCVAGFGSAQAVVPGAVEESAAAPAPSVRVDRTGKRMVLIPPGTFKMGDNRGPEDDERPAHQVTLTRGFYLDQYEVTRGDFAACVKAGVCFYPRRERMRPIVPLGPTQKDNWGLKYCNQEMPFGPPEHPLTCVNYDESKLYCEVWRGGRLTTEAEWEWAARGGIEHARFPWGDEPPTRSRALFDQFYGTKPVGNYAPNGYGLYDIAGSVWEWTEDWYDGKLYSKGATTDPKGPCPGELECRGYNHRTMRGGSWATGSLGMRVTYRNHHRGWNRFSVVGVRCAASVDGDVSPARR